MTGCHDLSRLPGGDSRCCEDPGSRLESLCPVECDHYLEKATILEKAKHLEGWVERECKRSRLNVNFRKTSIAVEVVLRGVLFEWLHIRPKAI